jgi:hypothetical protein
MTTSALRWRSWNGEDTSTDRRYLNWYTVGGLAHAAGTG